MRWILRRPLLAACALSFSLWTGTAAAQEPSEADIDKARQHMQAGAAFYNDPSGPKCEEAYREFEKAYELSGSLKAVKAMGICALELERDGAAIEHLERYLNEYQEVAPDEKAQLEADLTALKSAVAWVTIKTDVEGVTVSDTRTPTKGFPVTNRYPVPVEGTRLGIHPGQHKFTASVNGKPSQEWTISISNGSTHEHVFTFDPQAAPPPVGPVPAPVPGDPGPTPGPDEPDEPGGDRPIPPTVYIFGGLTVALAVPTVIFMVSASGAKGDFDDANGTASAAELEDLRSDVTTNNLLADIFLGATIASAAATAVFYFTRPTVQAAGIDLQVLPAVSHEGGGAFVTGTF